MKRPFVLTLVLGLALLVAPVAILAADSFEDVPDSNVHHDDIGWLGDNGVTLGCNPPENTRFCPEEPVLRQQMASFLRRLAENEVVNAGLLQGMTADELIAAAEGTPGPRGPEGPPGPQGPAGPQGPEGNANVESFDITVEDSDWDQGFHYGDGNVYRAYDVDPSEVGGTNLADFFNSGGVVLVYAQTTGNNGYNEWKTVPYVYTQDMGTSDIGIRIEYLASRASIVISETTQGWDTVNLQPAELPEEIHVRIVLIENT